MNKLISYGITFLAGGVIGALISHFVTKEKTVNEAQKKLDQMHEYYEEEYGHLDIPQELTEMEDNKETKTNELIHATRSQDPIVRPTQETQYHDYTQYYQANVDPAEEEHPEEDDPADEEMALASQGEYLTRELRLERAANRDRPPKIIKQEECGSNPAYKEISLTYCVADNKLIEDVGGDCYYDADEDLDAVSDLIGDALDKYGFRDNDEDSICVRNYKYGIDYNIVKYDGYSKDLVG